MQLQWRRWSPLGIFDRILDQLLSDKPHARVNVILNLIPAVLVLLYFVVPSWLQLFLSYFGIACPNPIWFYRCLLAILISSNFCYASYCIVESLREG